LIPHGAHGAEDHPAYALDVMLLQMRIDLLLDLRNFVYVFDAYTTSHVLPRLVAALHLTCCLLYKPRGRRRLHHELKTTVNIGLKDDAHGYFAIVLSGAIVEFLTELHHVDTEGTESLTDLGRGLGYASIDIETHGGLVSGTCIHFYDYIKFHSLT